MHIVYNFDNRQFSQYLGYKNRKRYLPFGNNREFGSTNGLRHKVIKIAFYRFIPEH